jgi:hypothetical protein
MGSGGLVYIFMSPNGISSHKREKMFKNHLPLLNEKMTNGTILSFSDAYHTLIPET